MKLLPPATDPSVSPGSPNVFFFKFLIEDLLHKNELPIDRPLKLEVHDWQRINDKLKDIFCQHHIEVTSIDTIADISNLFTGRMHMIELNTFTNKL